MYACVSKYTDTHRGVGGGKRNDSGAGILGRASREGLTDKTTFELLFWPEGSKGASHMYMREEHPN